jgi:site-specific recombinase XerD
MVLPRRAHREIDILTPEEVVRLMRACSQRAPTGVRNQALIALLFGCGARISEALSLRPKDVELATLSVVIQNGKGAKRRVTALLPETVDAIARWIDRRATLGVTARDYLFCTIGRGAAGPHPTAPGGRLSREYVARVLKRLARRAGVERRVHPHGLRHAWADLLRRRGFDVEELRVLLGHSSLLTTSTYLAHIGAHELPAKMRGVTGVLALDPNPRNPGPLAELLSRLTGPDLAHLARLLQQART